MKQISEDTTELVFVLTGSINEDVNTPEAPFQGQVLHTYTKTNGQWNLVMRNEKGEPYLGYLAREIPVEEAVEWKHRLAMAQANPATGYQDMEGHWFPGNVPNSLLTKQAWEKLQALREEKYISITAPLIIERQMQELANKKNLRALKESIGEIEAVKSSKSHKLGTITQRGLLKSKDIPIAERKAKFEEILQVLKDMSDELESSN